MTQDEIVAQLNALRPPVWETLNAQVLSVNGPAFSGTEPVASIAYEIGRELCHSEVIVQGGIVAAMIDSAMTCALFGHFLAEDPPRRVSPPSLEFKVSFFRAARSGRFVAQGKARKLGRTIAFLEGELFQNEVLVAAASMSSQLVFNDARAKAGPDAPL